MYFKLKLGFVRTDIFYIPRNCQVLVSRQVLSLLTVIAGLTGGIDRIMDALRINGVTRSGTTQYLIGRSSDSRAGTS